MESKSCPKCKGKMVKGIGLDGGGGYVQQKWAEGIKLFGAVAKNAIPIVSYRCEKCGYLENYAK